MTGETLSPKAAGLLAEQLPDRLRRAADVERQLAAIIARCRQDASSSSNTVAHALATEILKIAGERQ